jgi:H+/Cl- antiporter ClcA
MENKIMTHKTKGLLVALVLIIIGIAGHFGGLSEKSWFSWGSNIVLVIGIIWGCLYYAKQMDGRVSFGDIFVHGFKMSVVITLIIIAYSVLALSLIFPEMREKGMEIARQKMEEQGKMSGDQIDQALEIVKKFFWPITIGTILLFTLLFGCVASLIGAAVAKKKPVSPLDQFPA